MLRTLIAAALVCGAVSGWTAARANDMAAVERMASTLDDGTLTESQLVNRILPAWPECMKSGELDHTDQRCNDRIAYIHGIHHAFENFREAKNKGSSTELDAMRQAWESECSGQVHEDKNCAELHNSMNVLAGQILTRERAQKNLATWRDPPGSTSLCPKPHRMTQDGCQ